MRAEAAIQVDFGGALDLSSDDNTVNVVGTGRLLDYSDDGPLDATGTTLRQDGIAFADNFAIEGAVNHRIQIARVRPRQVPPIAVPRQHVAVGDAVEQCVGIARAACQRLGLRAELDACLDRVPVGGCAEQVAEQPRAQ